MIIIHSDEDNTRMLSDLERPLRALGDHLAARETLASLVEKLADATADAAWRQWTALASLPSPAGAPRASALVDPEALVLVSLALRERERRLSDILAWWAEAGVRLLSVQRMKKLASAYSQQVADRLREFAWHAHRMGGDHRWRNLAGTIEAPLPRRDKDFGRRPGLIEPPALLLRLRAGFGVGAKADLLGFLLCFRGGAWASIRVIAAATQYTPRALTTAADDMALGRLISATANKPVEYRVLREPWAALLGIDLPEWRFWQPVFAFVAATLAWAGSDRTSAGSDYMLSSEARELVRTHQDAFARNQIDVPRTDDHPGDSYLSAFADTLRMTTSWLEESV